MPRFYFDTDDGKLAITDEEGAEFQDLASAEDEAMLTLPEMVQSRYPACDWRQISALVRDEAGVVQFLACLALTVERVTTGQSAQEKVAA